MVHCVLSIHKILENFTGHFLHGTQLSIVVEHSGVCLAMQLLVPGLVFVTCVPNNTQTPKQIPSWCNFGFMEVCHA